MKIVPIEDIPKDLEEMPLDKPMEIFKVFQKMERLVGEENGAGLAAVQVGIPWAMFVTRLRDPLDPTEMKVQCYVDCKYFPSSLVEKTKSIEGCLSLKRNGKLRSFEVDRWSKIRVVGKKLEIKDKPILEPFEREIKDLLTAVVFQHEIDHQKGVLISDIGKEIDIQSVVRMD
jgi:peptide deformylase